MMKSSKPDRVYIPIEPSQGYPAGKTLYYECLVCGCVVPSMPDDDTSCKCRNIMIDVGFSRMVIDDPIKVRLFKMPQVNPRANHSL
ncbi:MAG: hypothetical protein WC360_01030 [Opitutales bacterium]|jgi:hypothetical protein